VPKNFQYLGQLAVIGIISGGLSSVGVITYYSGFNKDNVFAFLGAVIGAAIAVTLTNSFQSYSYRRPVLDELKYLLSHLKLLEKNIREKLNSVSAWDDQSMGTIQLVKTDIQILQMYLSSAQSHSRYLDFSSKMWIKEACDFCSEILSSIEKEMALIDEDSNKKFEKTPVRIRGLLNCLQLIYHSIETQNKMISAF